MNSSDRNSLLLVTVDCLRADHTGFLGYARPTTPFLDTLAQESLVFRRAVAAGAPTYYSFPALLASRFPLALGREVIGIAPGEPTLATLLDREGYRTGAFVAANPYLSRHYGYAQGFQLFEEFATTSPHSGDEGTTPARVQTRLNRRLAALAHRFGPLSSVYDELYFQYCQRVAAPRGESWDRLRRYPSADVLVDRARHWLTTLRGEPYFLWLHFMDPHAPYYPPADALRATGDAGVTPRRARYLNGMWNRWEIGPPRLRRYRDEIVSLYDAGIRWVDLQLARLVEMLRELSVWDRSVFVLTADHGEEFLDHGGRFHPPSRAYEELLRVPLMLRVPGMGARTFANDPFSHVHLAPTLLEALGIGAPQEFAGRSHWSEIQAGGDWDLAISESVSGCTNPMDAAKHAGSRVLAVWDRRHKLVIDFDRQSEDLFDLENDPGEKRPLPREAEKSVRAQLLQAALAHLRREPHTSRTELALRAKVRQTGLEWNRHATI